MKQKMTMAMLVVAVPLILLLLLPEIADLSNPLPVSIAGMVLLVAELVLFVIYTQRFGGVACPNCGYRVNGKYAQKRVSGGRYPCPKCGAMIEK